MMIRTLIFKEKIVEKSLIFSTIQDNYKDENLERYKLEEKKNKQNNLINQFRFRSFEQIRSVQFAAISAFVSRASLNRNFHIYLFSITKTESLHKKRFIKKSIPFSIHSMPFKVTSNKSRKFKSSWNRRVSVKVYENQLKLNINAQIYISSDKTFLFGQLLLIMFWN